MIARVLPSSEWGRLDGTELEELSKQLTSATAKMLVVERGDEIVGCCALLFVLHGGGVWIAPAHRKRGVVARRLLDLVTKTARSCGARCVVASDTPEEMTDLLINHLGATATPESAHVIVPVQ